MPAEWTDAELDLLSAYIDEQLNDSDRTALEARLAQDADLRQELAAMRQTVALLRDLPTIRAPRAFTLTPEMVGQKAVPMLTIAPAAAVQEKRQRPPRRVWWIPAASAAGVVLLAGIFAVTQMSAPTAAPANGSAVAMEQITLTPTPVQDFTTLNTVVDVRTTVVLGAASEATITGTPTTTALPTASPMPSVEPLLARTAAKIETVQVQVTTVPEEQAVGSSQDDENILPAPSIQGQAASATAQPTLSAPQTDDTDQPSPAEAVTSAEAAVRLEASPTSELAYNQQNEVILFTTPTLDIFDLPSGGGAAGTATPAQIFDLVPENSPGPDMITGMVGINPDPNAPGFSIATVAPIQGTAIAQYHAPADPTIFTADTTTTGGMFATTIEAPVMQEGTSRPPIWIRWINTLGDWLAMLFGQN
jgi:hypothetical protein